MLMHKWNKRSRPERLERRFEFSSYEMTRDFLDRLGDLCENRERFPDISFGKVYVNITVRPEEDTEEDDLSDRDYEFTSKSIKKQLFS